MPRDRIQREWEGGRGKQLFYGGARVFGGFPIPKACTSVYHGAPGGNPAADKCGGVDFTDTVRYPTTKLDTWKVQAAMTTELFLFLLSLKF